MSVHTWHKLDMQKMRAEMRIIMKSIKTKIIAAVVFCSLLSTVICGGISIVNSSKTSVEDSKRQMEIACITQTDKLDSVLSMFKH